MSQNKRILIGVIALVVLGAAVWMLEMVRGQSAIPADVQITLTAGSIPIYVDNNLVAGFAPNALEVLEQVSFVDTEEGKPQEGWLLRDVLLVYLPEKTFKQKTLIRVSSSSRDKHVELTYPEVEDRENMVMFDLSNKGTLKLVSLLDHLDTRDEWIQDVDRIEVVSP
jgi:hypothetical protein